MPPPKRTKPTKQAAARPSGRTRKRVPVKKPIPKVKAVPVTTASTSDATPAQRAEALIARLFELDTAIKSDFYEIGLALRELNREQLYRPLGFATFSELLRVRALPKRAMAYRLIDVVDHLDRTTARDLGVERSYHIVKYAQKKAPTVPVAQFIKRHPTFRFKGVLHHLRTAPTRILADLVVHLATGAPENPPAALTPTARSLGQIFHHLGFEGARVTSHHRGRDAYLTIKLPLADAKKLKKHLT